MIAIIGTVILVILFILVLVSMIMPLFKKNWRFIDYLKSMDNILLLL